MKLLTRTYVEQERTWPTSGKHILAQFDDRSIVVYQAYRPAIGRFAAANGYFGGEFKYTRMSWIKPNFLWMMYRCGWGTKAGQETILAVRLRRDFFDEVLTHAVPSSYDKGLYPDEAAWSAAVASSEVRLQWDPDHAPSGAPLKRRAVQLGLRGSMLAAYGREAIVDIEDVSAFVAEQRKNVDSIDLLVPEERVYRPADASIASRLKLSGRPEVG